MELHCSYSSVTLGRYTYTTQQCRVKHGVELIAYHMNVIRITQLAQNVGVSNAMVPFTIVQKYNFKVPYFGMCRGYHLKYWYLWKVHIDRAVFWYKSHHHYLLASTLPQLTESCAISSLVKSIIIVPLFVQLCQLVNASMVLRRTGWVSIICCTVQVGGHPGTSDPRTTCLGDIWSWDRMSGGHPILWHRLPVFWL